MNWFALRQTIEFFIAIGFLAIMVYAFIKGGDEE